MSFVNQEHLNHNFGLIVRGKKLKLSKRQRLVKSLCGTEYFFYFNISFFSDKI
jgi:hypothetical protein